MEDRTTVGIRPALPFVLLFALFALLGLRFFYIQILGKQRLERRLAKILERTEHIPAQRGQLFDRQGQVLAAWQPIWQLVADPIEIAKFHNPKTLAQQLAALLDVQAKSVFEKLQGNRRYRIIEKNLTAAQVQEILKFLQDEQILGLTLEEQSQRMYPFGNLAAHVLGFLGPKEGQYGLEQKFEQQLSGNGGWRNYSAQLNPLKSGLYLGVQEPAAAGWDLLLTMDAALSSIVHDELQMVVDKFKPKWASIVLLDPQTGDVLAMENYPYYDPNSYGSFPIDNFQNPAVAHLMTPGSSFKPFIMAAAVEEGLVDLQERIDCENGAWRFHSRVIHDHEEEGLLTPTEVLARSSNIGMAKIGLRLGVDKTEAFMRSLGLAKKTGIELPGEIAGIITPRKKWSDTYTLCSVSFGHEISITPIRLVSTFALFANGGYIIQPRIVRGLRNKDGQIHWNTNQKTHSQLSAGTLNVLLSMLHAVMLSGTGQPVASDEISIAGKTGTTVKDYLVGGKKVYTSIFLGFAPVESPALLVCVVIDEPRGAYYGSQVAAPAAVKILERSNQVLLAKKGKRNVEVVQAPTRKWRSQ